MSEEIVLAVLWDGRVLLNQGQLDDNMELAHFANFIVIDQHGELVIWKERFQHHLQGNVIDHRQMFQHATRHIHSIKEAGCFADPRRPGGRP